MTNIELQKHNDFLLKQMELTRKRIIQPVYRGDSLRNLCFRLNVEFNETQTDTETLLNRLFMVGEKAQRYYTDNENFRIEDAEDYVFDRIIKYYNDSIKSKNKHTLFFFKQNKNFTDFFSNKVNKKIFIEKIENAGYQERLNIRNYYLTILHQLAAINYKKKSHFVSTTRDYEIAEMFANGKREKSRIILHCWLPKKINRNAVLKYGLPTYTFHPYQYQREYSILGGILPHFISGLELIESREFYPNPNIFLQEIKNSTFLEGIRINQQDFHNIAELTNYKITLSTDGDKTWEN
ncbi:hypothetical protein DSM03_1011074 [Leeuwenhoekiella aestuarii]|uniref:Uncharacterized protein n=1 Tax=Leeuwenhoekiella aestuarii TaxID=2249426 RepID=A0A4V1KPZ3_9FLAO|nr:hypothetical protein [Leeuwenhoekiella aestuarii]RXG18392.1 hypothetical protein DSM04_101585 [Leeuwenhoekiella aestuarii]RXG19697.1 hypothetical protein DSM03_1011074 [Leeuwenhoekiella aestuarii]